MLIVVSAGDRTEGFLEWDAQGLYGRIVEAKSEGNARTFSLGDGGMNGVELNAVMRRGSIEVHYRPPVATGDGSAGERREVALVGTGLKSADGLRILTSRYEENQNSGQYLALRLQYLAAGRGSLARSLDEVLRRGKSPYQTASYRRSQQEEVVRPARAQGSITTLEYEEIEYPVFISDNFVSVATQRYLFNGGAHGAASTDFDVIERKTGRRLGLSDIFAGDEWRTGLSSLLKTELARQHGVQKGQVSGQDIKDSGRLASAEFENQRQTDLRTLGFFEPDIYPSEDVFLCESGIGFEYDRYQIAPWSMGEFILVLPWSEVEPYLNPSFLSSDMR
jgi:hypothetical protein